MKFSHKGFPLFPQQWGVLRQGGVLTVELSWMDHWMFVRSLLYVVIWPQLQPKFLKASTGARSFIWVSSAVLLLVHPLVACAYTWPFLLLLGYRQWYCALVYAQEFVHFGPESICKLWAPVPGYYIWGRNCFRPSVESFYGGRRSPSGAWVCLVIFDDWQSWHVWHHMSLCNPF